MSAKRFAETEKILELMDAMMETMQTMTDAIKIVEWRSVSHAVEVLQQKRILVWRFVVMEEISILLQMNAMTEIL